MKISDISFFRALIITAIAISIVVISFRILIFDDAGGSWTFISTEHTPKLVNDVFSLHVQHKGFSKLNDIFGHGGGASKLIMSKLVELNIDIGGDVEDDKRLISQKVIHEKSSDLIEFDHNPTLRRKYSLAKKVICLTCQKRLFDSREGSALYRVYRNGYTSSPIDDRRFNYSYVDIDTVNNAIRCEFSSEDVLESLLNIYPDKKKQDLLEVLYELNIAIDGSGEGYYFSNSHETLNGGKDFIQIDGCNAGVNIVNIPLNNKFIDSAFIRELDPGFTGYVKVFQRKPRKGAWFGETRWTGVVDLSDNSSFKFDFPLAANSYIYSKRQKKIIFYTLRDSALINLWVVDLDKKQMKKINVDIDIDYDSWFYRLRDKLPTFFVF